MTCCFNSYRYKKKVCLIIVIYFACICTCLLYECEPCTCVCVCRHMCAVCTLVCTGTGRPQVDILCLLQLCSVFFLRDVSLNLPKNWPIYLLLPSLLILRTSSLCLPKARIAGRLPWVLDFYFLTSKFKPLCLCEKHFIHWTNPKFCYFLWWGLWHSTCDVFTESCPNS